MFENVYYFYVPIGMMSHVCESGQITAFIELTQNKHFNAMFVDKVKLAIDRLEILN